MDLRYHQLLQLVDRLYRLHGTGTFAVSSSTVSLDVAEQLCGFGLVELHARPSWPRGGDLDFRAVPVLDSPAPYTLVPWVRSGADVATTWTANLTEEAEKLAYGQPFRLVRILQEPPRVTPAPRLYGRWPFQTTLDSGRWAPEQVTLFEELSVVAPSGPRRRRLFGR